MAQLKNSLAPEGKSIAFEINENATIRWIGEYDVIADELLGGEEVPSEGPKISEAAEKLEEMLREKDYSCVKIYEVTLGMGISKRSVDRAKKKLDVKSIKCTDGWYWSLERGGI